MSYKVLYVGDPHVVCEEIGECERLWRAVARSAHDAEVRRVVLLGDQHHNHSTMRVEVLSFWKWAFRHAEQLGVRVVALVGNHDLSNDGSCHAMAAYPEVDVVDAPRVIDGILHLPYLHAPAEVVAACRAHPTRVAVTHAAWQGTRYENGIYVGPEGVDPEAVPQTLIITGHVHKPGRYGKVWNMGAPRWRIATDANEDRAVWIVQHADDGLVLGEGPMDTAPYCRRIVDLRDVPEAPAAPPAPGPLVEVRVTVAGPTAYVRERATALEAMGCRVSTVRTDAVQVQVSESEGIPRAWARFLAGLVPARGTTPVRVRELASSHYGLAGA